MTVTRDGIARHVSEQSQVWQRQTALDRIDLLAKEAALHHSDDDLIDMLGTAAANAARAHARVGEAAPSPEIEDGAAAQAHDRVLAAAVQARLTAGSGDSSDKPQEVPGSGANDVQVGSPNLVQVSEDPRAAYRQCAAECAEKFGMEQMRPKWFSESDRPSLMRICIRACLAEKGDFNY